MVVVLLPLILHVEEEELPLLPGVVPRVAEVVMGLLLRGAITCVDGVVMAPFVDEEVTSTNLGAVLLRDVVPEAVPLRDATHPTLDLLPRPISLQRQRNTLLIISIHLLLFPIIIIEMIVVSPSAHEQKVRMRVKKTSVQNQETSFIIFPQPVRFLHQ
jgi:hypothetical protein